MAFLSLARGELVYHASMPVLRASLSNQTCGFKLATTYSHTSYDKNGNLTEDAEGRQFLYDAEKHQTEVKDNLNNTIGKYFY